jgi:spore germination protein
MSKGASVQPISTKDVMHFTYMREAGVRLPKQVGAAVSIAGALVIGQAATSAGLVSAPMVMVVAITGVASFMMQLPRCTLSTAYCANERK